MPIYLVRTGTATAKQVNTQMTTQGSVSAPGGFNVPAGTAMLTALIGCLAATVSATGQCVVFARLTGQGITSGEQDIALGGVGASVVTSGVGYAVHSFYVPIRIPVVAGAGLNINFDTDTGGTFPARLDIVISLEFS